MKKSLFLTLMLSLALSHPLVAEEVTVGTGTGTNTVPFYPNYKYSTTESIYTASQLGGSGTITSISYNCNSTGTLDSEVKIYMGHKAERTFSSGTDYMPASALTLVYDHSVTLGGKTGWVKFDLDKQFEYKGDQNLVVVICKSATNTKSLYYYETYNSEARTIRRYSDGSSLYAEVEETAGFSTYSYSPNIRFEFLSDTIEKDGATYLLRTNTGCATLVDGQNCSGNLIIPNAITDAKGASYNVTAIKAEAFKNNTKITSVSIPEHVSSIANSAFYGCSGLTSIIIPNSVTSIGSEAFYNCSKLSKVCNLSNLSISKGSYYDNGYVGYYANAVYKGTSAGSVGDFHFVTDSEGKTTLWNYTGSATDITLPEKYEGASYEIGAYTFYNRTELTSVTIPNSVTSIGTYAFCGCI